MRRDNEHRKRGQAWSIDYTIGFLLFLATCLLTLFILSQGVLLNDTFTDVHRAAERLSDQLLGTGYPVDWTVDDVVTIGLMTNNELSMKKLEAFETMTKGEYGATKRFVNTPYEYALTLRYPDGTIVPVNGACYVGSAQVTSEYDETNKTIANAYYHHSTGPNNLAGALAPHDPVTYDETNLKSLLDNARAYDFITFEEARFGNTTPPYDDEKATALEAYVENGGTLLLTGNTSLAEAFDLNVTPVGSGTTANGTSTQEDLFAIDGEKIIGITPTAHAITSAGQRRYASLAKLNDGTNREYAARFTYGDGTVYYVGSTTGVVNSTGKTIAEQVAASFNTTLEVTSANCTNVSLPLANAKQLVNVERLVAYKGRVATLTLALWERK